MLLKRDDVDAAGLQHRAFGERELMHRIGGQLCLDRGARIGQEAGAHPIGDIAEPQIEAGGLDLRVRNRRGRGDLAAGDERAQGLGR